MIVSDDDLAVIEAICGGLPLVAQPYAEIGRRIDMSEAAVIDTLQRLVAGGVIRRFGVVVQHRRLGYTANGMSVWNVPDERVAEIGHLMGDFPAVTLCYQRPRKLPDWPYNLFAMVHGSERDEVRAQVDAIAKALGLQDVGRDVLFSNRQFKQCGARYSCKGKVDDGCT